MMFVDLFPLFIRSLIVFFRSQGLRGRVISYYIKQGKYGRAVTHCLWPSYTCGDWQAVFFQNGVGCSFFSPPRADMVSTDGFPFV